MSDIFDRTRVEPITFDDAREQVRRTFEPQWGDRYDGAFYVSTEGLEDADDYCIAWGAREYIVDGDPDFMLLNGSTTFVDKLVGQVRQEFTPNVLDKLAAMRAIES